MLPSKDQDTDNKNPLVSGDHSSIAVKELHNTVDRHTDSHDVVTTSNLTDSHDVVTNNSHTVVYNGTAATEQILMRSREEYRRYCREIIDTPVISRESRLMLDEKASMLQLAQEECTRIESSIISTLGSERLTATDRATLDMVVEAISRNEAAPLTGRLVAIADKSSDEEVQYYANMLLAIYEPGRCISRYSQRTFDSYWQTFWVYLAYKKRGEDAKAESVLAQLQRWTNYPESNAMVLSTIGCCYDYFTATAPESMQKAAYGYLSRAGSCSALLDNFKVILSGLVKIERPLYLTEEPHINFYLSIFGAKKQKPVIQQTASTAQTTTATLPYDNSVYAEAHKAVSQIENTPAKAAPKQPTAVPTPIAQPADTTDTDDDKKRKKNALTGCLTLLAICAIGWWLVSKSCSSDSKTPVEEQIVVEQAETTEQAKQTDETKVSDNHRQQDTHKKPVKDESKTAETQTSHVKEGSAEENNSSAQTSTDNNTFAGADTRQSENTVNQVAHEQPAAQPAPKPKVPLSQQLAESAASGNASAAVQLGVMYFYGDDGVKKSSSKAFAYFKQAAESGNIDGMYWYGMCYRMGRGTAKNRKEAKKWFQKAAAGGHSDAAKEAKKLESLM